MKLKRELAPCSGCSQAKESREPTKQCITTRAVKPGGRVFVNRGGEPVQSPGRKKYMMIVKDGKSRFTKVCFLRSKGDTTEYFMKYLVDIAGRKLEMATSND